MVVYATITKIKYNYDTIHKQSSFSGGDREKKKNQ